MQTDERFMRTALSLARRQLGRTWPNPAVGALVVKNGAIIGQGATANGGRPHAEPQALAQAGEQARGATLYVTLEPCSHQGKTPPCVDAILNAGISRCVIALGDPNPLVNGQGIARLRQAGIEVTEQVCEAEAAEVNRGFLSVIRRNRPYVALKLATSLDGKIATASGESQWITGPKARAYGHLLRSRYDAIATGIGTVLADDPLLTCRLPGLEDRSPLRVVFDRQGRFPLQGNMAASATATQPLWIMGKAGRQEHPAIEWLETEPGKCEENTLSNAVYLLALRGITRLLVESGPALASAFLKAGLVDRLYWFRAPVALGNDAVSAIQCGLPERLASLPRWRHTHSKTLGDDQLDIFECLPES